MLPSGVVTAGTQIPRLRLHHDVVVSVSRVATMLLVRNARVARVLRDASGRSNKSSANNDRQDGEAPHSRASFRLGCRSSTEVDPTGTAITRRRVFYTFAHDPNGLRGSTRGAAASSPSNSTRPRRWNVPLVGLDSGRPVPDDGARHSRHRGRGAFTVQAGQRAQGTMTRTFAVVRVGDSFPVPTAAEDYKQTSCCRTRCIAFAHS